MRNHFGFGFGFGFVVVVSIAAALSSACGGRVAGENPIGPTPIITPDPTPTPVIFAPAGIRPEVARIACPDDLMVRKLAPGTSLHFESSGDIDEVAINNLRRAGANLRPLGAAVETGGAPVVIEVSISPGLTDSAGHRVYALTRVAAGSDGYIVSGTMKFDVPQGTHELGVVTREVLRALGYMRASAVSTGGVLDPFSPSGENVSPEEAIVIRERESDAVPALARCEQ